MEKLIAINHAFDSLDELHHFLTKASSYPCYIDYDVWDFRIDNKGQMEQCLIIKKSAMHAVKLYFTNANTVKVNYIIPNKLMHAYFGKPVKARRNIIEILTGLIKQTLLAGPQQKAFEELEAVVYKAA